MRGLVAGMGMGGAWGAWETLGSLCTCETLCESSRGMSFICVA